MAIGIEKDVQSWVDQHTVPNKVCASNRRRYDSYWAPIVENVELLRPQIGVPALAKLVDSDAVGSGSGTNDRDDMVVPSTSSPERALSIEWLPSSPPPMKPKELKLTGFCFEDLFPVEEGNVHVSWKQVRRILGGLLQEEKARSAKRLE